ncbi:MAG: hypothetical protein QM537_03365 [Candidatus Symbiobacter sp.]|nr:hypothetical protein [Candidatus Symbiobacter sp.]
MKPPLQPQTHNISTQPTGLTERRLGWSGRVVAALMVLAWAGLGTAPVQAQTTPQPPPGVVQPLVRHPPSPAARDALRQALLIYEQSISLSNLDYYWKTNAMAQICRSLARFGDVEQVRTMAQNLLANAESAAAQGEKPPPPAFGKTSYYAIMAEAFADIGDAETATGMVNLAQRDAQQNGDAAAQATFYPFLARVLIKLQRPDDARKLLDDASGKLNALGSVRERIAALFALVNGYVRLGDNATAARHQNAAVRLLGSVNDGLDRALAEAFLARGAAMLRQLPEARQYALDSSHDFNRATRATGYSEILAAKSLSALALAWREMGDGNGARQTLIIMRRVIDQTRAPYERFLGWIALTDTIVQVEQPSVS